MLQTVVLFVALVSQSSDSKLIIEAGKEMGVQSIKSGRYDQTLQDEAEQYAKQMAEICRQDGHGGWDRRMNRLIKKLPQYSYQEITAESWSWQDNKASAPEMFKCWRQSPGHWSVANGNCAVYGYAMARGRNNIYYGVGIVGKRR